MTGLPQIIADLVPAETGWRGHIPENWLQGRTSYGGLSAALALHVAQQSGADLPPLRSAQVAFIGPLAGDVTIRTTPLRRGRNAAWVQAEAESEAGLGLRAVFVFMGATGSSVVHQVATAPAFPPPGPDTKTYPGIAMIPFTQNFEFLDKRDVPATEWLRWARLNERSGLDPMVELIAIADCLPPAAIKLMKDRAPISSMTWQLNALAPVPTTTDGWWLLQAATDYARSGSSSQFMRVWNTAGETVAEQTQAVALFG